MCVPHIFGGVGAGESHQRPERDARAHDKLPVVPVAQVTKDRCQKHVAADEDWRETRLTSIEILQTRVNTGVRKSLLTCLQQAGHPIVYEEIMFDISEDTWWTDTVTSETGSSHRVCVQRAGGHLPR